MRKYAPQRRSCFQMHLTKTHFFYVQGCLKSTRVALRGTHAVVLEANHVVAVCFIFAREGETKKQPPGVML